MSERPASPSTDIAFTSTGYVETAVSWGDGMIIKLLTRSREAVYGRASAVDETGAVYWPAATLLARLLHMHSDAVRGQHVIELGCGSALLSCVCTALHASSIIATDASPDVLPMARANMLRNGGSAAAGCRVAQLRWESADDTAALRDAHPRAFDVAVASEVLYVHRGDAGDGNSVHARAASLFRCSARLLRACDGSHARPAVLLVIYTPRYRGMMADVHAAAASTGMALRHVAVEAPLLTAEMVASMRFGRTRMLVAAPCARCVQAWMATYGLPARRCGRGDDSESSEEEEEDADPLRRVVVDGAES